MWCTFVDKVSDLVLGQVTSTKGQHGYIVACLDAFMYTEGRFVKCLKEYCVCVVVGVPLIFLCVAEACYKVYGVHILLRAGRRHVDENIRGVGC